MAYHSWSGSIYHAEVPDDSDLHVYCFHSDYFKIQKVDPAELTPEEIENAIHAETL
jgi:hypothetical protein